MTHTQRQMTMEQLMKSGLQNNSMIRVMEHASLITDEMLVTSYIPASVTAKIVSDSVYQLLEAAGKTGIIIIDTLKVYVDSNQKIMNSSVVFTSVRVQTLNERREIEPVSFIEEDPQV